MPEQYDEALRQYSCIKDIGFPFIDPTVDEKDVSELAGEYYYEIIDLLIKYNSQNCAVHLMGELTFVYILAKALRESNVEVVASTTMRDVYINDRGKKISTFKFVRFRKYI